MQPLHNPPLCCSTCKIGCIMMHTFVVEKEQTLWAHSTSISNTIEWTRHRLYVSYSGKSRRFTRFLSRGRILGRNWYKSTKEFPPLLFIVTSAKGFNPPPPWTKWFEAGLSCNHCIRKPQVWELSRLCPETSTKLFGFRKIKRKQDVTNHISFI